MKLKLRELLGGVAAVALAGACADVGSSLSGYGNSQSATCKTVYVYHPSPTGGGVIQPTSSCGGLPRDRLDTLTAKLQAEPAKPQSAQQQMADAAKAQATGKESPDKDQADAKPKAPAHAVSQAALKTQPGFAPKEPYGGVIDMLQNADMASFMARVHQDYADKKNAGAWGYAIIDSLAANDVQHAQDILDEMSKKQPAEMLSANHLRPWVFAYAGRADQAQKEMAGLRRILLGPTLMGHRALLAEGLGDTEEALKIYGTLPDKFDAPKPEDAGSPTYLQRAVNFNGQRTIALRQAELLRGVGRDADAVALLTKLSDTVPDDAYVSDRLRKAKAGEDKRPVRTLPQAMAQALEDEADLVEERQSIMSMMVGRGAKVPFNQLLSSLRQSALLLDPDNGDIRLQETSALYQGGFFEPALRIAQMGNPRPAQQAALASTAALAALELDSPQTLEALTDRSLKLDSSPEAKISAAGALTSAGLTDKALKLVDQALKEGLSEDRKPFAMLTKGQAKFQAGDIAGAVQAARDANKLSDTDDTKQFLASMLVKSPNRGEGLDIMRGMLADSPGNSGLMNNFGYSLIDGYANEGELDEGFRLLKEASRMTPDEPNLLDSLGWGYYLYGDFREAKRFLDLAVAAYAPFDHWELYDHRGDIEWRLGDQAAAKKDWQASIAARPPKQDIARLNAKLAAGLTEKAPVKRDPPDVPHVKPRGESQDI